MARLDFSQGRLEGAMNVDVSAAGPVISATGDGYFAIADAQNGNAQLCRLDSSSCNRTSLVSPPQEKRARSKVAQELLLRTMFYENSRLYVVRGELYPTRGQIVDRYDLQGKYLDSFALETPRFDDLRRQYNALVRDDVGYFIPSSVVVLGRTLIAIDHRSPRLVAYQLTN